MALGVALIFAENGAEIFAKSGRSFL